MSEQTVIHQGGNAYEVLMKFYVAETKFLSQDGGDFSVIAECLDEHCVLFQPASLPYGGRWDGPEGFQKWMVEFGKIWSRLEVHNPEFFPSGDDVIFSRSHIYATSRITGADIDWPLLQFFKIKNGKILELRPFHWDTAEMVKAFKA